MYVYNRSDQTEIVRVTASTGSAVFEVEPRDGGRIYRGDVEGLRWQLLGPDCKVVQDGPVLADTDTLLVLDDGYGGVTNIFDDPPASDVKRTDNPLGPSALCT